MIYGSAKRAGNFRLPRSHGPGSWVQQAERGWAWAVGNATVAWSNVSRPRSLNPAGSRPAPFVLPCESHRRHGDTFHMCHVRHGGAGGAVQSVSLPQFIMRACSNPCTRVRMVGAKRDICSREKMGSTLDGATTSTTTAQIRFGDRERGNTRDPRKRRKWKMSPGNIYIRERGDRVL